MQQPRRAPGHDGPAGRAPSVQKRTEGDGVKGGWRRRALERSPELRRSEARVAGQTDRLVVAARELYGQAPRQEFTVQQLSEKAGVSVQTFYRYFPTKDDLMLAVLDRSVQDSVESLERRYGALPDVVERLRGCTVQGLRYGFQIRKDAFLWNMNAEQLRLARIFPAEIEEIARMYEALLERCISDGVARDAFKPSMEVKAAAAIISVLIAGIYHDIGTPATAERIEVLLDSAWVVIRSVVGLD